MLLSKHASSCSAIRSNYYLNYVAETLGSKSTVLPVVRMNGESSTPRCGKICSYDWDSSENGKFWPLLRKAVSCSNIMQRIAHSPIP